MNVDGAGQFVDTNILVYGHDVSAGAKHEQAQSLIQKLWESGHGCLSIQVLQEFYVTITRKVARRLPADQAGRIISTLGAWRIHSPTVADIQQAITVQTRYNISFWDAMIICSAAQLGCTTIWSEDLQLGQSYESVIVINPF